ncbi:hypothetical protein DM02DRAFT_664450, partial [Periconia macrospinosa]
MAHNTENTRVILSDPKSYQEWITALQTRANIAHVWHLFDPMGTDMPLVEPVMPQLPTLLQFVEAGEPEPLGAHVLSAANKKIWDSQLEYYKLRAES